MKYIHTSYKHLELLSQTRTDPGQVMFLVLHTLKQILCYYHHSHPNKNKKCCVFKQSRQSYPNSLKILMKLLINTKNIFHMLWWSP